MLDIRTALKRGTPASAERVQLRAAITAAAEADRAASVAAGVAQRAQADVARARAALDAFAGLRARVIEHRTSLLERGEAVARELPPDIAADRQALAVAQDDADDALATYERLDAKMRDLAAAAEQAKAVVQQAVLNVMASDALGMMARCRHHQREAALLRVTLVAFMNQFSWNDRDMNAIPSEVQTMSTEPVHVPLVGTLGWTLPSSLVAWHEYRRDLAVNPAAAIEAHTESAPDA